MIVDSRHFYPKIGIFPALVDAPQIRITKELRVSPSDLSELIVSLGGVKFWVVAMVPLYIGWVLAQPPATRHLFPDDARLILALLVIGPFLSTFTLLFNTMPIPAPGAGHAADPGALFRAQVLGLEGTLSGALTLYSVLLAGLYAAAAAGLGSRYPFLRRHLVRALLWIGIAPWLLGALILGLLGKYPGG